NLSTPKSSSRLPNGAEAPASELAHAMSIKTNDQLMAIYLSSLIRAITAFHDLIENKIQNKQQGEEKEASSKKDDDKAKEDKEKKTNGVANGEAKEGDKSEKAKGKEKEGENKKKR